MNSKDFSFVSHGKTLFGSYWNVSNAKAAIILLHGMGEHLGRYNNHVIPKLMESGFSVITYDQFGHGKSEGKRGHNPGYEALLDCVAEIEKRSLGIFGNMPLFLYGHSMGGNLVINYTMRRESKVRAVVATSPFLKLAFNPPVWKMSMGRLLLKIAPSFTMPSELEVDAISSIKKEVEYYVSDPLVHDKISPNYSFPIIDAGAWAIDNAEKYTSPILLIHGTGDRITDHKSTIDFANKAPGSKLELIDGGYHELHNDIAREKVLNIITNWLLSQLS